MCTLHVLAHLRVTDHGAIVTPNPVDDQDDQGNDEYPDDRDCTIAELLSFDGTTSLANIVEIIGSVDDTDSVLGQFLDAVLVEGHVTGSIYDGLKSALGAHLIDGVLEFKRVRVVAPTADVWLTASFEVDSVYRVPLQRLDQAARKTTQLLADAVQALSSKHVAVCGVWVG